MSSIFVEEINFFVGLFSMEFVDEMNFCVGVFSREFEDSGSVVGIVDKSGFSKRKPEI